MEFRKTPQADLENERTTFFLLGFTIALATLFILLEWRSEDILPVAWEGLSPIVIENEYAYAHHEMPVETRMESEIKPVLPDEKRPAVVYEGYNVGEEVPGEAEGMSVFHEMETPVRNLPKEPTAELLPTNDLAPVFAEAEIMPQYPGGYAAMNRYLFNNLKYPASALAQRIEGRVWCSFIVNQNGSLSDIQIEKSVYVSLDQEALRALQTMPAWTPGTVRGQPVRVKVYIPIVFKL